MLTMRRVLAASVLCVGMANASIAQDGGVDVGQIRDQIRSGDTVFVTHSNGRETRTPLRDAGAAEVERFLTQLGDLARNVARIEVERSDSLWNGTLLGLAVAGTPWLIVCGLNDWCYYNEYGAEDLLRTTALTTAAIGAGVGALWDLSVRQKVVVYDRPKGTALKVDVDPGLSRTGVVIRLTALF